MVDSIYKLSGYNSYVKWAAVPVALVGAGLVSRYYSREPLEPSSQEERGERVFANPSLLGRAVQQISPNFNTAEITEDAKNRARFLTRPINKGWLREYLEGRFGEAFVNTKYWSLGLAGMFVHVFTTPPDLGYALRMPASMQLNSILEVFKKPVKFWQGLTSPLETYLGPWTAKVVSGLLAFPLVIWVYRIAQKAPPLHLYNCQDFTRDAEEGKIPPTVGQEEKKEEIVNWIGRDKIPVLVGPSGVGKTALVKSLAHDILKGRFPQLRDFRIFGANTATLKQKGAYGGNRLEDLLKKLEDQSNCILFLDEVHALGQNRFGGSSSNEGEEFKSQYDKVPMIAATTQEEFDKYIKTNEALNRRFQPIVLKELVDEKVLEVLRAVLYDEYPDVYVDEGVIEPILEGSKLTSSAIGQPSKAIGLLRECMTEVRMQRFSEQNEINRQRDQIAFLRDQFKRSPTNSALLSQLSKIDVTSLEKKIDENKAKVAAFKQLLDRQRYWNQIFADYAHRVASDPSAVNLKTYVFIRDQVIPAAKSVIAKRRKALVGLPLPILTKEIVQARVPMKEDIL